MLLYSSGMVSCGMVPSSSHSGSSSAGSSSSSLAIVPVKQLWPTPVFWPVNRDYPGLRAVCADPDIYLVDDLLSEEACEALIAKAEPHLTQSLVQSAGGYAVDTRRTSSDVRCDYDEVYDLQTRFADVLGMPLSHLEPLKVSRYEPGQRFGFHHDCIAEGVVDGCDYCPTPQCNRVATLLVYLRDAAEGGATHFPNLEPPLSIQPRRGLGLIFFPASARNGERDARIGHEGQPAVDEKWVAQQWGWTGPLVREELPDSIRAKRRLGDVAL